MSENGKYRPQTFTFTCTPTTILFNGIVHAKQRWVRRAPYKVMKGDSRRIEQDGQKATKEALNVGEIMEFEAVSSLRTDQITYH